MKDVAHVEENAAVASAAPFTAAEFGALIGR